MTVTTSGGTSRGACFGHLNFAALVGNTILPRGWTCSAQVGKDVWIISGDTVWGQTGLVEKVNLPTRRCVIDSAWMIKQPATNTGAAAIGTKIYVVGGIDRNTSTRLNKLQIFDTTTGKWTNGKNLPIALIQPAVASYKDKLYVFGGQDVNGAILKTTYMYNPATNTWAKKADLPSATAFASAVPNTGTAEIWVLGGFYGPYMGNEQNLVQVYNAATNKWTSKPTMKYKRGAAAGVKLGKICCLHGSGDGTYARSDGENFSAGAWKADMSSQQGLYTPVGGAVAPLIYVLVGYDYSKYTYSNNIWSFKKP